MKTWRSKCLLVFPNKWMSPCSPMCINFDTNFFFFHAVSKSTPILVISWSMFGKWTTFLYIHVSWNVTEKTTLFCMKTVEQVCVPWEYSCAVSGLFISAINVWCPNICLAESINIIKPTSGKKTFTVTITTLKCKLLIACNVKWMSRWYQFQVHLRQ